MKTDVLIVGGGMAGLRLAQLLTKSKIDFRLVEARARLGGRMLTEHIDGEAFDLGPAWFWAGQPRIAQLAASHNISVFEQFSDGDLVYEDEQGHVQRHNFSSMAGSLRLEGGYGALIDAMAATVPPEVILLNCRVTHLQSNDEGIIAKTSRGDVAATRIVLSLPPRLIGGSIAFEPPLPDSTITSLQSVPTWMASQAKVVAIYDRPFWREHGLSGDAMSRQGPLVEVHDASPAKGGPFALFGFVGVPPQRRKDEKALREAVLLQLVRLFGVKAATPISLLVKDWAFDTDTSTSLDHTPPPAHPEYGMLRALHGLWEGQLLFSGTETATQFGGYAEGALEAAEATFNTLVPVVR